MHDKGQVGLTLGREHTGWREARVVDERRVLVAHPLHRVRRVRDDGVKGLVVPVLRLEQRVAQGDVELVEIDLMQKHVDAGEVVCGDVDLLAKEAAAHALLTQNLLELEQQRTGAARRVVDLVHARPVADDDARQELGHLLRREELAARFARRTRVHVHEKLVGIAKQIDLGVADPTEVEPFDTLDDAHQAAVAFGNTRPELVRVEIDVVEQAAEILFGSRPHARPLDSGKHHSERLVKVGVPVTSGGNVLKELRRKDEKALFVNHRLASTLGLLVIHRGIRERHVARLVLALIDVAGKLFGDEPVEQKAKHVRFEVPAVHGPAHIVCNLPNCLVQRRALGLLCALRHRWPPFLQAFVVWAQL